MKTAITKKESAQQQQEEQNQKLEVQLAAVYGDERGQEIAQSVYDFKEQNPGKTFSFIFDEHGKFQAFEKRTDIIEDEGI